MRWLPIARAVVMYHQLSFALYNFTKRNGRASIRIGRWVSWQLARI
jgi:hypothetical protein